MKRDGRQKPSRLRTAAKTRVATRLVAFTLCLMVQSPSIANDSSARRSEPQESPQSGSDGAFRRDPTVLSPEDIFEKAREAWDAYNLPATVEFVIAVRVREMGLWSTVHYAGHYFGPSNKFIVRRFSEEELAHPFVPHGINVDLVSPLGVVKRLSVDPPSTDFLGYPQLSPRYSFGLERVRQERIATIDTQDQSLKIIANSRVNARNYGISLAGIESVDGRRLYHLLARPLHDPNRFRLRELWIDETDFSTSRIVISRNFTSGPALSTSWTITFRSVEGVQYIDTESANSAIKDSRRIYDEYQISFENVKPLNTTTYLLNLTLPDNDGGKLNEP